MLISYFINLNHTHILLVFHCPKHFLFMVWQELERRLALQEQDVAIVKTVKSDVARVPDLEKELKRLREDNAFLRSNIFLRFNANVFR